ncbi:MAG: class I SAM-dependent methyltransferase [Dehalococcoidia bacterium]
MDRAGSELPANIAPNAFAGTAEDYARYRPPYPAGMVDDLLTRVSGRTRLLDLACGPGRIALALVSQFESVLAVDSEPEMVAVGQRLASERGIANVSWRVSRAEELTLPASSLDLITIGEAFHRLDQPEVLASAMRWLHPGGVIASMGSTGILQGREPWQTAVTELAREWTRDVFPDGWAQSRPGATAGPGAEAEAMRRAGFTGVESRTFTIDRTWTAAEIPGYLRTTSVCSRRVLGARHTAFESALRDALLAMNPDGLFFERMEFGYTAGQRPD